MAGLAQKGGPVWSHIRIADDQEDLFASRIAAGEANLVLGCDIVVAVADDTLSKMRAGVTHAVINSDFSVTSEFVRSFAAQAKSGNVAAVPDLQFPRGSMESQIAHAVGGADALDCVAATRIATALLGDSIATNLFMVGYAYQKGLIPVSAASILKAVEMNGAAVEMNKSSFVWGRRAALDLGKVTAIAAPAQPQAASRAISETLDEMIARRVDDLTGYQNARYARRYSRLVQSVRDAEARTTPGLTDLSEAVARYAYKMLAYKDEYEVARLHSRTGFVERTSAMFEGDFKLKFHLAPPLFSKIDPVTHEPVKRAFGPWILTAFGALARLKVLRATPLDVFSWTEDRKLDRALLAEYENTVAAVAAKLTPANHAVAVELASWPELVRGFGHIRVRHAGHAAKRRAELAGQLDGGAAAPARTPALADV